MSKFSLIPKDSLTEDLLAEVIAKMIKNAIARKRAAATSEFPRPNVAAAGTQSVQTDTQADSTIFAKSSQNDERAMAIT